MRAMMMLAAASLTVATAPARAVDPTLSSMAQDILTQQAARQVTGQAGDILGSGRNGGSGGGLLGGIFGCSDSGNKQTIGAVAGGAVGGLLGNKIAGSGNRTLGTLLGGALGAAAGSALGCKLQKNDRLRAERATQAAIASNRSQSWTNEETGASGRVDVASATGATLGDLKFASGVEPAPGFVKVGDSYVAASAVNVRSAPGSTGSVIGRLTPGQRVWIPASVKGQPWLLVAEGGVGQGYVSAPLLRRATTTAAASNCRMVTQSVAVPGSDTQAETYHACKGPDGNWAMTRA